MSEAKSQKDQRIDKLKAQQKAIRDKAKEIALKLRRAESADKLNAKKQDDRTKVLLGVAFLEVAKRNPQVRDAVVQAINHLGDKDKKFLMGESDLFGRFLRETGKSATA